MEDTDGGLHPTVDGQSLDEDADVETCFPSGLKCGMIFEYRVVVPEMLTVCTFCTKTPAARLACFCLLY